MQIGFNEEEVCELVEAEVRARFKCGDDAHVEVTHQSYCNPEWKIEIYSRERWMKKLDKERQDEAKAAKQREAISIKSAKSAVKEMLEAQVPADAPF